MNHIDYRTLLDRGRKAGLRTSEIYRALAACPARGGDPTSRQLDSNGFVPVLDKEGHRVYVPESLR